MAATSISVNKQSVLELLSSGMSIPFVIPEYQRPYAWTKDEIETMFEDIWEFADILGGSKRTGTYFLGSVVSFDNENGESEIIDGQQRITSLFLLLRAIYTKLKNGNETDEAKNFISQIEPAIWMKDKLTGKVDYSKILLTSKVVNNESGNEILRKILETGTADAKGKDNYSKNYLHFQEIYDKHCTDFPLNVYDFIYALLMQVILLPISADSQDTALTIFSTLNDRGLPLSDADIFKAKMYNNLPQEEKDNFIQQWQVLEKEATDAHESIQQLFYYFMFYLRAKSGDTSSTTPGIRKYYSENKFSRLYEKDLMMELTTSLNLWRVINTNYDIPDEPWRNNSKIRRGLDILTHYPNEFWKYPVLIYYMSHKDQRNFVNGFDGFLYKLIEELMKRYILFPTINAVKADILRLNANIVKSSHPEFTFRDINEDNLQTGIIVPHRNIVRMLLKSYAYNYQDQLLPFGWEIEHILPQKYQQILPHNIEIDEADQMIGHIGNLTPFEKSLNIAASNNYFKSKQAKYEESQVQVTKTLATNINDNWTLENIGQRDNIIATEIKKLLKQWDEQYRDYKQESNTTEDPSAEELEQIRKFKENGWV